MKLKRVKIFHRYKEAKANFEEISIEEFIDKTEGRGYWKKGTALDTLINSGSLWTDYSEFVI